MRIKYLKNWSLLQRVKDADKDAGGSIREGWLRIHFSTFWTNKNLGDLDDLIAKKHHETFFSFHPWCPGLRFPERPRLDP